MSLPRSGKAAGTASADADDTKPDATALSPATGTAANLNQAKTQPTTDSSLTGTPIVITNEFSLSEPVIADDGHPFMFFINDDVRKSRQGFLTSLINPTLKIPFSVDGNILSFSTVGLKFGICEYREPDDDLAHQIIMIHYDPVTNSYTIQTHTPDLSVLEWDNPKLSPDNLYFSFAAHGGYTQTIITADNIVTADNKTYSITRGNAHVPVVAGFISARHYVAQSPGALSSPVLCTIENDAKTTSLTVSSSIPQDNQREPGRDLIILMDVTLSPNRKYFYAIKATAPASSPLDEYRSLVICDASFDNLSFLDNSNVQIEVPLNNLKDGRQWCNDGRLLFISRDNCLCSADPDAKTVTVLDTNVRHFTAIFPTWDNGQYLTCRVNHPNEDEYIVSAKSIAPSSPAISVINFYQC